MPRTILHIDLDAFFCAVEENQNPSLRGKAFAVGGKPDERGVVASCSYAARRNGVRSAMPMSKAIRLSPGLLIVPSRHRLYGEVSRQVMAILHDQTPLVEQISIDEAFLDISDIRDNPNVRTSTSASTDELHLPAPSGSRNKLLAKLATEVGKALALQRIKAQGLTEPPNAVTVVGFGDEAAFLNPLPVDMLWGVGPKTSTRLTELGIRTIGDLAKWPESELIRMFGENGRDLARHSKGIDDASLSLGETKSSQEVTYLRTCATTRYWKTHCQQSAGDGSCERIIWQKTIAEDALARFHNPGASGDLECCDRPGQVTGRLELMNRCANRTRRA
jgi:DNA polymerase-4